MLCYAHGRPHQEQQIGTSVAIHGDDDDDAKCLMLQAASQIKKLPWSIEVIYCLSATYSIRTEPTGKARPASKDDAATWQGDLSDALCK